MKTIRKIGNIAGGVIILYAIGHLWLNSTGGLSVLAWTVLYSVFGMGIIIVSTGLKIKF